MCESLELEFDKLAEQSIAEDAINNLRVISQMTDLVKPAAIDDDEGSGIGADGYC